MELKLYVNSARDLKHVNWRSGRLQPYAVVWIDSGGKRSTKVDESNGIHPVWNERFTIPLPSKSRPETAILHIDIVHAESKQHIGSVNLPLQVIIDEALSKGMATFSLILERPSGRPQGSLEIQIEINNSKNSKWKEPCQQQVRNMSQLPLSQPQPGPRHLPQQMNQYHNMPATIMPRCPANSQQNFRPTLVQQPGNVMFMPSMRPQYRPAFQQPPLAALNRLILDAGRNHAENMMMQSVQQMQPIGTFQGTQGDMGMFNDTGNSTYGASDYAGASADGQLDTNGEFDNSGLDFGGFDGSGCDFGGYDNSGLDFGGFSGSGCDFGGFDV